MKTFLLIDANALVHRAFHALPPLTAPSGEPIGAVYGLSSILLKTLKDWPPQYIAAAFDRPEPTFRKEMFADYKAHRPPAAEELISQIIKAHELFGKFGIKVFEEPGFEADDIIGAFAKKFAKEPDLKIVILTGDLDTLQLVSDDKIVVQTMKKGVSDTVIYNEKAVEERYGLKPEQLPDYKGLAGDPSDNIPGVKGIGPKGASKLLQEYGTIEKTYESVDDSHPLAKKLLPQKEQAFFSKKLATINSGVKLNVSLEGLAFNGLDTKSLTKYFTELGFTSLLKRTFAQAPFVQTDRTEHQENESVVFVSGLDCALANKEIFESDKLKVAFDWKPIIKALKQRNVAVKEPLFDIKIAGWLLDPDQKEITLRTLAQRFLYKDVPENPSIETLQEIFRFLKRKLKDYELLPVFEKIEMPLIKVLAAMEQWGIGINTKTLKSLEIKVNKEIQDLAQKIYKEADGVFNINSPRQIGEVLFEKLGIKTLKAKKTSGGQRRTDKDILEDLRGKHPIVELILNYRENTKIESTYIRPFLELEKNGKIHTTFIQTGTATGRLSSEKPNLQNIPQESKWSNDLRSAFETPAGWSFVTFDYSQLELRLLAHVSDDEKLKEAFFKNLDIHQLTASQIFNVSLERVTPEMRRLGKTLNFGVVYGMGPRAFSETSELSFSDAQNFIEEYFHDFPAVRDWQQKVKAEAATFGYVKNLNGRRRWFLNISGEQNRRQGEFERAAVNMPIQSLGADILKTAMNECFETLNADEVLKRKVRILLSIHDELLFEVSNDILEKTIPLIKNIMEKIYPLSIPLKVEVKKGLSWGELEKV